MEADTDGKIIHRVSSNTAMEVTRPLKRRRIESVEELEVNLDRTPSGSHCSSSVQMRTSSCSRNVTLDLEDKLVKIEKSERKVIKMREGESTAVRQSKLVVSGSILDSEIEEFFSRTTKEQLKVFQKKYNFDFEKEEPLEGNYDWINLK